MKSIHTLIPDIYAIMGKTDEIGNSENSPIQGEFVERLSRTIGSRLEEHFQKQQPRLGLRLSKMGADCPRSFWYATHHPELAEALPPWAKIKYSYGHILEALVIALAVQAGHTVEGEQDEIIVDGISGHRDCVIDGCVVDVKSASTRSFQKFRDRSLKENDPFGYLEQLDGYVVGSLDDPIVKIKDRGYILAIDKTLGKLALYEHFSREDHIRQRIRDYKKIFSLSGPPPCTCETVPDGKSGNIKLGLKPSYSSYRHCCWPNLRTFLYASGPVYLTKVVRKPDVPEINRAGQIVHN